MEDTIFQGIQTFCSEIGEAACYALSIIKISSLYMNLDPDVILVLKECIKRGYIKYNWNDPTDNDNFYVAEPAKMLTYLTDCRWTCSHVESNYQPQEGEYVVDRWERVSTGNTSAHFRLPEWDSVKDSVTVKKGKIVSRRIFRKVS